MMQRFSKDTEEGLRLVWRQFDPAEILRGRALLEKAAKDGDPEAFCLLARTYLGKDYLWEYSGLTTDEAKAAQILKDGICAGSACGVLTAIRCGELTPSVRRDMPFSSLEEAWNIVYQLAADGNHFCQYLIGEAYYNGDCPIPDEDVPPHLRERRPDPQKAVPWLEKALAGGFPDAGHTLDRIYQARNDEDSRRRVTASCATLGAPAWEERLARYLYKEDHEKGLALFQQAADHGQITSLNTVGRASLWGVGAPLNPGKAFQCFKKGAEGGDFNAQRNLAWLYLEGQAVPKDAARAAYWISCAANAPEGQREYSYPLLAHCTLHGLGAPQDIEWGLSLLAEAMEFNLASSYKDFRFDQRSCALLYRDMGEMCEKGLFGSVQLSKAASAYLIAANQFGDAESAQRLKRFQKGMFGKWKLK